MQGPCSTPCEALPPFHKEAHPTVPAAVALWGTLWHWNPGLGGLRWPLAAVGSPIPQAARMTLAVALFGLFVAALGLAGVVSPDRLLAVITHAQSRLGLYGLAGLRLLIGVALLLAASASRAPLYLMILGGLALASGVLSPFVGARRLEAILTWWRSRSPGAVRLWSAFALAFGLSVVWAVFP